MLITSTIIAQVRSKFQPMSPKINTIKWRLLSRSENFAFGCLTKCAFCQATFASICTPKDTCQALPQSQPLPVSHNACSQNVKVRIATIALKYRKSTNLSANSRDKHQPQHAVEVILILE